MNPDTDPTPPGDAFAGAMLAAGEILRRIPYDIPEPTISVTKTPCVFLKWDSPEKAKESRSEDWGIQVGIIARDDISVRGLMANYQTAEDLETEIDHAFIARLVARLRMWMDGYPKDGMAWFPDKYAKTIEEEPYGYGS